MPKPITLTHPDRPLSPALLDAPGGFAWWYLDGVDAAGNGLVAIWSFGLPFLPGYLDAARRGRGTRPASRPSLNLALYEAGEPTFYLLQEYPEDAARWDGERIRLGRSVFTSRVRGARLIVSAHVDCPVPAGEGARLRGEITLTGPRRVDDAAPRIVLPSAHDWSPLVGPARITAALHVEDTFDFSLDGRGYHDRNGSTRAFDQLGIRDWIWGRAPFADREAIYYLLFPESRRDEPTLIAMTIDDAGRTELLDDVALERRGRRVARYGMPHWDSLEITSRGERWLSVSMQERVDDGPFYLRFLSRATNATGERVLGTTELVRPGRVDRASERPFVRMKVHDVAGPNSSLLPLFTGPARGRVARQLTAWSPLGGRASLLADLLPTRRSA